MSSSQKAGIRASAQWASLIFGWEGVVEVFEIQEHATATRCYAWSHRLDKSKKRRFFAVLHQESVDSPEAAVRATIVSKVRKTR